MKKILIANRGEIAVRIIRAAQELGIATVAIYSEDDAHSLHCKLADEAIPLKGQGAGAYLDIEGVIAAAQSAQCEGIHPGYGFLSENPAFARQCQIVDITFVGPTPQQLETFGDKSAARALAAASGVPLLKGTAGDTDLEAAKAFLRDLPAGAQAIIKAIAGGGGRGMRLVESEADLETLIPRAKAEAEASFGDDRIYLEQFVPKARHIEVQIIGDGQNTTHLWERECTIQRNHQKIVEIAPSPV